LGPAFRIGGIRLDSGDLCALAFGARRLLDDAGLRAVTIFASGGLNEEEIAKLLDAGAPIDAFGVGTDMGVSRDAPSLDIAYKLVEYAGRGRTKLSTGKSLLPGRKQVFRIEREGVADRDVIGRRDESLPGRPLLRHVMAGGVRTADGRATLDDARARARAELDRLPPALRALPSPPVPYRVDLSDGLALDRDVLWRRYGGP
jgi:nicotinate phosphoribosyltransferase